MKKVLETEIRANKWKAVGRLMVVVLRVLNMLPTTSGLLWITKTAVF
jgi:hypothetical protein